MGVTLYMDVHVPGAITRQLRRRGVNVLTAQEDGHDTCADEELLARANALRRILFTHDVRFRALAEKWQRQIHEFAGLIFGSQLGGTIGQYVQDLELIAKASEPDEWRNVVQFLPFRA